MTGRPRVVKKGTWLYGGSVPCAVLIMDVPFQPGAIHADGRGNIVRKDPDRPGPWFHVQYGSPVREGKLGSNGGFYASLDEAEAEVERKVGVVAWEPSE